MDWLLIGKLFLILFLIVGNAFFVGSEIALTSARRSRINQRRYRQQVGQDSPGAP